MGDDASAQPGLLGDMMLHETAVSWIRELMGQATPARAWEETRDQLKSRIQKIVRHINVQYDVDSLCRELPDRLQQLKDVEGDKLEQ